MSDLFVPQHNDLENKMNFGYVTRLEQQNMYKLDLQKMKYVKLINLEKYNCVPQTVSFVPLGQYLLYIFASISLPESIININTQIKYRSGCWDSTL